MLKSYRPRAPANKGPLEDFWPFYSLFPEILHNFALSFVF